MREIARRTKFIAPRDYSSALEIRRLCLQKIGHELPESTLVEMEALPLLRQLPPLKQEAPLRKLGVVHQVKNIPKNLKNIGI